MQSQRGIMLFSPPLPPIPLTPEHPVVIGRLAECDVALRHSDVSRQHAEVGFEGEQYVLRDLGSTNGTFLNGKEITVPTPLSPGDKIELGSRVVTFCALAPGASDATVVPDGDRTVIAERLPSDETFAGDLSQIPPCAVLQVLEMERKSGILGIDTEEQSCKVWFDKGVPIHAESQKQSGFDAALGVAQLEQGRFRFEPQPVNTEATIACTVTELLMESCRLLDERSA